MAYSTKPQGNEMTLYPDFQQDEQEQQSAAGHNGNHPLSLEPLHLAYGPLNAAPKQNAQMDHAMTMVEPSSKSSEKRNTFASDSEEDNDTQHGPVKRLRVGLTAYSASPPPFPSDHHVFHNPSTPIIFQPRHYASINASPIGEEYLGIPHSDLGTAEAGNAVQAAFFPGAPVTSRTSTANEIPPQVQVAAKAALDALRNAIKRDGHVHEIQEPVQGIVVRILTAGHFYTQHHQWLLAAIKIHGLDVKQFPSCSVDVNSVLLQQKTFLWLKSCRKFRDSPLQDFVGWEQHQGLAMMTEHCELLYGWAAVWHDKKDNGPYTFTPFVNEGTLANAGQRRKIVVRKSRDPSSSLSDVNSVTNTTNSQDHHQAAAPAQGFPHTTMILTQAEIDNALQWGQATFEGTYLPMRIEGRPQFAAKDIFPNHPSSLEKSLVDDSTPILTVLQSYPNHIPSIGRRIMRNKTWSNQRIANLLFEHGHQSIFSNFDEDVQLSWLKHWVKRRRGTATQGQRQAEKKTERMRREVHGTNETESDAESVRNNEENDEGEDSDGVESVDEAHETTNRSIDADPLSFLGENDEAETCQQSTGQLAAEDDHEDLITPLQQNAAQNDNDQTEIDGPTATTDANGSYFEEAIFGTDLALGEQYHRC